jgi:hypothetical protein
VPITAIIVSIQGILDVIKFVSDFQQFSPSIKLTINDITEILSESDVSTHNPIPVEVITSV